MMINFKKATIILLLIMILTSTAVLYSAPMLGILDDAKSIGNDEEQIGAVFGSQSVVYADKRDILTGEVEYTSSVFPLFFLESNMFYPFMALPSANLGFLGRYGFGKRGEFSFNVLFYSPNFYDMNFMGPSLLFDFGLKGNLVQKEKFNFSYKFNWGILYNARPGGELITKHSFMFGTNKKRVNSTFVISLQSSIGGAMPFTGGFSPYFFYATATPGTEINWSVNSPGGFTFAVGIFARYEMSFALSEIISNYLFPPNYDDYYEDDCCYYYYSVLYPVHGKFEIGINFAWMGRYKTESGKVNWSE